MYKIQNYRNKLMNKVNNTKQIGKNYKKLNNRYNNIKN